MNEGKGKFYSISETGNMTGVSSHILRYWEKEFSFLKPLRDNAGRRLYSEEDIKKIEKIKDMLYNECYRITGAKKKFLTKTKVAADSEEARLKKIFKSVLKGVKEIEKCLR